MFQRFRDVFPPFCLLFCGLFLFYPLVWGAMLAPDAWMFWPRLTLVDNAVAALLALFFLLALPRRMLGFLRDDSRVVKDGCLIALMLLGVLLAQQIRFTAPFPFASGLFLIVIPLFGAAFAPELRRVLPWFALALFLLNLAQLGSDWYFRNAFGEPERAIVGLASNWNWSATLLVACAPLIPVLFARGKSLAFGWLPGGLAVAAVLTAFLLEQRSKGMLLALGCTMAVLFLLRYPGAFTRRRMIWGALGVVVLLTAAALRWTDALAALFQEDVRYDLWRAAWKLFWRHPLIGCGQDLFIGHIDALIPDSYHLSPFAGTLHYHPHNELLLLLSELGIVGGLYFAGVIAVLFVVCRRLRGRFEYLDYALLASTLMILLHGMVDMTLYAWPLRLLFFVMLGMLWHRAAEPQAPIRHMRYFRLFQISALCALVLAIFLASLNLLSGYCYRTGSVLLATPPETNEKFSPDMMRQLRYAVAMSMMRSALTFRPNAHVLYMLGTDALRGGREREAIRYFRAVESLGYESYLHSNGMIARACVNLKSYRESLPFFEEEQRRYPFGSVNPYFHSYALNRLGDTEGAWKQMERCKASLKLKGLRMEDLPALIRNPDLDDRIPAEALAKLKREFDVE